MSITTKGLDYYGFAESNNFSINYQGGSHQNSFHSTSQIQRGNFQIGDDEWIPRAETYSWQVLQHETTIANKCVSISPLTGNLEGGDMTIMMNTPSIISEQYAISYGFYDAGSGTSGLTNQDQSYVYVTQSLTSWMGDYVKTNSSLGSQPFASFALAGAHDAGMNNTVALAQLISDPNFQTMLSSITGLAGEVAINTIINTAFTQKDSFTNLLNLGVRYFDFRPGYCVVKISNNLYHQHNFIPGAAFSDFLDEILSWLISHSTEIVVINLNFQGFHSDDMKPTISVIRQYWEKAQQITGTKGTIVAGDKNDLENSYNDLIGSKKRLLFLNQLPTGSGDSFESFNALKYDSYSDSAYQTTDVNSILKQLDNMNKQEQQSHDYTVLQLQGTATGVISWYGNVSQSQTASPLMSTKPSFDMATYAWITNNVSNNFDRSQLMIFLNDFCDNALVKHGADITVNRLQLLTNSGFR